MTPFLKALLITGMKRTIEQRSLRSRPPPVEDITRKLQLLSRVLSIGPEKDCITLFELRSTPVCIDISLCADENDEEVRSSVGKIFNSFLVHKEKLQYQGKDANDLNGIPGRLYIEKIENLVDQDTPILNHALTNLAVREDITEIEDKDDLKFKVFATAEKVRHAQNDRGSLYRRLITNALSVFGVEATNKLLPRLDPVILVKQKIRTTKPMQRKPNGI